MPPLNVFTTILYNSYITREVQNEKRLYLRGDHNLVEYHIQGYMVHKEWT